MTKVSQALLTAALASLTWIPVAGAAQAQKPAREQPSQAPAPKAPDGAQQPGQPPMGSPGEKNDRQMVMLTGQIQQQNGQFVLSDAGVSYKLDQQDKAKRFAGQKVKVMGTLEVASNTVYVDKIEPAA